MAHNYSKKEIEFIKANVKGKTLKQLTEMFNNKFNTNVSEESIQNLKARHNLKSYIQGGQFEKGHIPSNKGQKMTKEQYEKCKNTMFKKGNTPHNKLPLYTERINKDGYIEIKIEEPNKWKLKNRLIYEKEFGEIPKGHKVIFADGNKRNFDINNLILVTNGEEAIMNKNGLFNKNSDITKIGVNIAKVLYKIGKRKE